MKSPNETVEYGDYKITVGEATTLMGMRRTTWRLQNNEKYKDSPDEAVKILSFFTYPDLMAVVTDTEGFDLWPISFELFLELPDRLVGLWEEAVYRLNPHWQPGNEAEEKKQPNGSGANLSNGTPTPAPEM
jgi:hypothetical protein